MYKTNPELFFSGILHFFPDFFGFYYIYLSHSMSQEEVLELALAGHNIILTGQCGTGKTYLLKYAN
jgi:Cdc6-like AAA superfamily ATPase